MMKPERWQQIDQVLEAALERDSSERAAFLDQACAGDSELRQEVESLLAHDSAESFVGGPAVVEAARVLAENARMLAGQSVGQYQIVRSLGAGGWAKSISPGTSWGAR